MFWAWLGALVAAVGIVVFARLMYVNLRRRRGHIDHDLWLGAEESAEWSQLFWNVRSSALRQHPTVVRPGAVYDIETALEPQAAGLAVMGLAAERVVDRVITFALKGDGIEFATDAQPDFSAEIRSPVFRCGANGTEAFAARWRAVRDGPATLTILLEVDAAVLGQLGFLVEVDPQAATITQDSLTPVTTPLSEKAVFHSPRNDVLIELVREAERLRITYLSVDGDRIELPSTFRPAKSLDKHVRTLRTDLKDLSGLYPISDAEHIDMPDDRALKAIARIGSELRLALFGGGENAELRSLAERIAALPPGTRVEIDDCGAAIPWGIVYDGKASADIDPEKFWGVRLQLHRRVVLHESREPSDAIKTLQRRTNATPVLHSFINPHVEPDAVAHQVAMEKKLGAALTLGVQGRSNADLAAWVDPAANWTQSDVLYLYAHADPSEPVNQLGIPNGRWPDDAAFVDLDAAEGEKPSGSALTTATLLDLRRVDEEFVQLPDTPIVFVNACSSGRADEECVINPIVLLFLIDWGLPAFVGADWPTPQRFAAPFAEAFLTRLLEPHLTVGDALWLTIRSFVIEHANPFALNYCLFGRADATLDAHLIDTRGGRDE